MRTLLIWPLKTAFIPGSTCAMWAISSRYAEFIYILLTQFGRSGVDWYYSLEIGSYRYLEVGRVWWSLEHSFVSSPLQPTSSWGTLPGRSVQTQFQSIKEEIDRHAWLPALLRLLTTRVGYPWINKWWKLLYVWLIT